MAGRNSLEEVLNTNGFNLVWSDSVDEVPTDAVLYYFSLSGMKEKLPLEIERRMVLIGLAPWDIKSELTDHKYAAIVDIGNYRLNSPILCGLREIAEKLEWDVGTPHVNQFSQIFGQSSGKRLIEFLLEYLKEYESANPSFFK